MKGEEGKASAGGGQEKGCKEEIEGGGTQREERWKGVPRGKAGGRWGFAPGPDDVTVRVTVVGRRCPEPDACLVVTRHQPGVLLAPIVVHNTRPARLKVLGFFRVRREAQRRVRCSQLELVCLSACAMHPHDVYV